MTGSCSSSLLAVTHSCNSLVNGELDFVLVGGVDVNLDYSETNQIWKAQDIESCDTGPYDSSGNGVVIGEGCGMFLLAREKYARAAKLHYSCKH